MQLSCTIEHGVRDGSLVLYTEVKSDKSQWYRRDWTNSATGIQGELFNKLQKCYWKYKLLPQGYIFVRFLSSGMTLI